MGHPPPGLPNPFGGAAPFDPSKPDAFGKTRYHYKTLDGGPPLDGKVPAASLGFGGIPGGPTMPCFGGLGGLGGLGAGGFGAGGFGPGGLGPYGLMQPPPLGPPPAYSANVAGNDCPPGYVRVPAPPHPRRTSQGPTNNNGNNSFTTAPRRDQNEPPLSGNRVKGQLISLKDGTGVIMPRETAIIHVFTDNLITKHPPKPEQPNMIHLPFGAKKTFTAQHVPCNMSLREFILQIDCQKRANTHFPYNQPGRGYPEDLIGVQELVDLGEGWFALGEKVCLADAKARMRVGELFGEAQGEAGGEKPRYIVRFPV